MDSIITSLNDLSWWFNIVFAGVIIPVAGSYFRDGLTLIISKFSKSFRKYRKKIIIKDQQYIDFLISNPDILAMEITKILVSVVIFLILILLLFFMPAIFIVTMEMAQFRGESTFHYYDKYILLLTMISLLIITIRLGGGVAFQLKRVLVAYRKYCKKKHAN